MATYQQRVRHLRDRSPLDHPGADIDDEDIPF